MRICDSWTAAGWGGGIGTGGVGVQVGAEQSWKLKRNPL